MNWDVHDMFVSISEDPVNCRWEGTETSFEGTRYCNEQWGLSLYCHVLWCSVQRGKHATYLEIFHPSNIQIEQAYFGDFQRLCWMKHTLALMLREEGLGHWQIVLIASLFRYFLLNYSRKKRPSYYNYKYDIGIIVLLLCIDRVIVGSAWNWCQHHWKSYTKLFIIVSMRQYQRI